jgi:hypothetical protein
MNGTFEYYQQAAIAVAQVTGNVLTQRPGTDPTLISRWLLTKTVQGDVWLFAELDDQRIPKFEPYEAATHHLSSSLKGMPVLVSNHTGLRFAFLLSPVRKLPATINLPETLTPGRVMLGLRADGRPAGGKWSEVNHMIVVGMTGSGKSVTVRSIVYQAIRQNFNLLLGDLDGATFPMLAQHKALLAPLVGTAKDYLQVMRLALGEIENRVRVYASSGAFPESVDEYNAWALKNGAEPLKRVLVVLDEFNSAVLETGGANGELARLASHVAWRGRKFGITLVFAAQDFSKEIIGRVRDQIGAVIAHRVRSEEVARNLGLAAAARISENRPGRAVTDRWGLIQAYFLDKQILLSGSVVCDGLTAERALAQRALRETEGKISLEVLMGWGMGQREARRLQEDWKTRGWAEIDPARKNGLYITAKISGFADKLTNLTNLTNRPENADKLTNSPDKLTNSPTYETYLDYGD